MNELRRYIRRIIIEDKASFEKDYIELLRDAGVTEPDDERYKDPYRRYDSPRTIRFSDKKFGKQIKRLWNQNADHAWFDSNVDTIHFAKDPRSLLNWPTGISKDEISCTMHLKNQKIKAPKLYDEMEMFGYIGLMVKGRITLAVNDMDFAITGFRNKYNPSFGANIPKEDYVQQRVSSGINKYPGAGPNLFNPDWKTMQDAENPYVFDGQSFERENTERNEALVDNWKVVAIVAPRDTIEYASENPDMTGDQAFIYDLSERFRNVPVIDYDRNDLTSLLLA